MAGELWWEREGFESRVDAAADAIEDFVGAVLADVDVEAARASPAQWEQVCTFFYGCASAACQQTHTPDEGGKRIADYLKTRFPEANIFRSGPQNAGVFEFLDWLANPKSFRPSRLRELLKR